MSTYTYRYIEVLREPVDGISWKKESQYMVPVEVLSLKHYIGYYRKHTEANTFLNNFKLDKVKRSTIASKTKPVCRNLATILKEGYAP